MVVQDVKYSSFAFQWMNCFLVREFTLPLMFRVWDLFLSDHARITATHVYVCGAMLVILAPELLTLEGPEFIMKVQNLPLEFWTLEKLETVLAQAFVYEKRSHSARIGVMRYGRISCKNILKLQHCFVSRPLGHPSDSIFRKPMTFQGLSSQESAAFSHFLPANGVFCPLFKHLIWIVTSDFDVV
jgi:hypothetical protein